VMVSTTNLEEWDISALSSGSQSSTRDKISWKSLLLYNCPDLQTFGGLADSIVELQRNQEKISRSKIVTRGAMLSSRRPDSRPPRSPGLSSSGSSMRTVGERIVRVPPAEGLRAPNAFNIRPAPPPQPPAESQPGVAASGCLSSRAPSQAGIAPSQAGRAPSQAGRSPPTTGSVSSAPVESSYEAPVRHDLADGWSDFLSVGLPHRTW
jgi:hypothetical protein